MTTRRDLIRNLGWWAFVYNELPGRLRCSAVGFFVARRAGYLA